jgi:hypothetical protein
MEIKGPRFDSLRRACSMFAEAQAPDCASSSITGGRALRVDPRLESPFHGGEV